MPSTLFIVFSCLFHIFVILILTGQFSFFKKKAEPEEMIIVEMFDAPLDKKVAPPKPVAKDKPEPIKKETKPRPAKKYVPPKAMEKPTAKPEAIKPLKNEEAAPITEDNVPMPMDKAEDITKPRPSKPAPVPAKRPAVKPKPAAEEKKKEVKKEDPKNAMDFQSVLKNLADSESQPTPDEDSSDDNKPRQSPMLTQPPPVSQQVTQGEMQVLIAQLGSCWSMLAGAKNAENLYVDIRIVVNPDRTLRSHQIVDKMRYNNDSFFRAAADSAVRALYAPRCRVLNLPPYKYDQWNTMTVRFDPKQMF